MRTRPHAAFAPHVTVSAALAAVFAVLVVVLAPVAAAAPATSVWRTSDAGAVSVVAQGQADEPGTGATTAPPGPRIEPEESAQADEQEAQRKAIVAAVAAALLVIVILGRRARNKSKPGKDG